MARSHADLMARLDEAVLDRESSLSDILNTCMFAGIRIGAPSLHQWAKAELDGYRGLTVPDYRTIRAQVLQVENYGAHYNTQLLNVLELPDYLRDHITEVVRLNQGVTELEALAADHEAQQQRVQLGLQAADAYMAAMNARTGPSRRIVALYAEFPPALIRGVLGKIRAVLTEFVGQLGAEVDDGDDAQPSADQADSVLRSLLLVQAVITNLNVFTGTSQAGGIVATQHSEYNFGGVKGNVAAGSSNFSQAYNESFDLATVREFAELIGEISGTLDLSADQQAELDAGASELRAAIDDPAADKGRMRRAVNAVMSPLKLAARPPSGTRPSPSATRPAQSWIPRFVTCTPRPRQPPRAARRVRQGACGKRPMATSAQRPQAYLTECGVREPPGGAARVDSRAGRPRGPSRRARKCGP